MTSTGLGTCSRTSKQKTTSNFLKVKSGNLSGLTLKKFKSTALASFWLSTILLRLSFSVYGLSSVLLLIGGVLFGLIILKIYQLAETKLN